MTKLSILSASLVAAASSCLPCSASAAFVPVQQHQVSSLLPMTAKENKKSAAAFSSTALEAMYNGDQEVVVAVDNGSGSSSKKSIVGSSTLPGNLGFDPLNLAQTKRQLVTYRQAEIKHGRLAMLVRTVK